MIATTYTSKGEPLVTTNKAREMCNGMQRSHFNYCVGRGRLVPYGRVGTTDVFRRADVLAFVASRPGRARSGRSKATANQTRAKEEISDDQAN